MTNDPRLVERDTRIAALQSDLTQAQEREKDLLYALRAHEKNLLEHSEEVNRRGERVRVLTEALVAFPEFPRECAHDAEPDYCDCCAHEWEKTVGAWKGMRTAALNPNQPEEPR